MMLDRYSHVLADLQRGAISTIDALLTTKPKGKTGAS
jgi:hypothetical protein